MPPLFLIRLISLTGPEAACRLPCFAGGDAAAQAASRFFEIVSLIDI